MAHSRLNAQRKASNQGMKQVSINDVNLGIANGTIESLKPFTTPDGFLYTNPQKGSLIFVATAHGQLYSVARYITE